MGKYSDIVNIKNQSSSSEPESKPENQKTVKEQNIKAGRSEQVAINQQSAVPSKPENQKASETETQKSIPEDMVNLSIKVPRRLRQKWVAESRLRGTTLTAIISDYLKVELGE